jgi:hypothetical protein
MKPRQVMNETEVHPDSERYEAGRTRARNI